MADKGAHFFRCDLQVHTPRDINWSGNACVTDNERQTYARSLVQACRDKGLEGIAVTDHHDMLFASIVRRAAAEETDAQGKPLSADQQLVVFPGMELTLGVPCQALLLFDADFPDDLFELAMNTLTITPNPPKEAKTAQVQRLNHVRSLIDLKTELDKYAYLRERYIFFPNVTNEGQYSILRVGMAGKYIEMPCGGGYIDGDIAKLTPGIRNRIDGKDKAWGNKRIACLQTSDNRREDHEDLGKYSSWIKWAKPTAEALRQACLAQESRISHELPRLPAVGVASISVSNSAFLAPIDLEMNPQYTALIGGRGTGKSTILEYLRWALCDQPPGLADEDTPNYLARRARLIEQTLKPLDATVQVRFDVNEVAHTVRRNSQDGSLLMKIGDGKLQPCTEEEVRSLLPIQAYSQKQLSEVSVRIEELGSFITAPIRADLSHVDRQIANSMERVRQAHASRLRKRSLSRTVHKLEMEKRSLAEQEVALSASITGLSEDDSTAIERGQSFEMADRTLQSWRSGASSFRDDARTLGTLVDSMLTVLSDPPAEPEGALLAVAHAEYRSLLTEAKRLLETLITRAETLGADPGTLDASSPWRQWSERMTAVRDVYEAAVARSSTQSEKLKQLKSIEERITQHAREAARIGDELRAVATAEAYYSTERGTWLALLKEQDDLLAAQCTKLTANSSSGIRAEVRRFADASPFVRALRADLSGSRISGAKIDALGESITNAPVPEEQWNALLLDLERLAEFEAEQDGVDRRPDAPKLAAAGLTSGEQARLARALNPEKWLSLSLIPIKSVPVFDYRTREGGYIPFKNASAGQQATALLKTLLNQGGPPLIIDQPEEDLDNPVMLEVVEQVWQAKQNRQLIFASHNANLVVNGDAELVVWCAYRTSGDQSRGTIAGEGAIDVHEVRDAAKAIMEGGEAAFNLRKEKYGF